MGDRNIPTGHFGFFLRKLISYSMNKYNTKDDHLIIRMVEENDCVLDKELMNELAILLERTPKSVRCRFYNYLRVDCFIYHYMMENLSMLNNHTNTLLRNIATETGIDLDDIVGEFYDIGSTRIWSLDVLKKNKIYVGEDTKPEELKKKGLLKRLFDKIFSV